MCCEPKDTAVTEVLRDFPAVRAVAVEGGCGPGGSRNRGIDAAVGEVLAFTDCDCIAEPAWLSRLVDRCRQQGDSIVSGYLSAAGMGLPRRASDFAELGIGRPRACCRINGLCGGNFAVAAKVVATAGARFGERIYGAEEQTLRYALSGQDVLLEPAAVVVHIRNDRLVTMLGRMYRLGAGSAITRLASPMRGSVLVRHRWLLPLLPAARLALTAWRMRRCDLASIASFALLWPLVLLNLVFYTAGFYRSTAKLSRPASVAVSEASQ